MRDLKQPAMWAAAAAAGVALLLWAWPRAFPFAPRGWEVTRGEAETLALERFRDLGKPLDHPYVVTQVHSDLFLEHLLLTSPEGPGELAATRLARRTYGWRVTAYPQGAQPSDWTYRAVVTASGGLSALRLRLPPEEAVPPLSPVVARQRADAFLVRQGFDLARYEEPELRSQELEARTDLTLRYRAKDDRPGVGVPHGIEVQFAGDRLAGFSPWLDDPQERQVQGLVQQSIFLEVAWMIAVFLAAPFVGILFLRRYHAGEVGVRRGLEIFGLVLGVGLLWLVLNGRVAAESSSVGFASRQQLTWLISVFILLFNILPVALLAFFGWSVGESLCRERFGHRLAAFDALFRGRLGNHTVARSSAVGIAAGLATAGAIVALPLLFAGSGARPYATTLVREGMGGVLPGLSSLANEILISVPGVLVAALFAVCFFERRLGRWGGIGAAVAVGVCLLHTPFSVLPAWGSLPLALVVAAVPVLLFRFHDLLAALLAHLTSQAVVLALPLLYAAEPRLVLQGCLPLLVVALPLLLSVRHLVGGEELVYRYEDIPPHVRRIAERERQRVELETARRIQSSILPELPPRLAGVELAHAYRPASEVGGDFYDVLALEDGRLALAVGDVAGHGVSSGLVMAMAKSALAVQVCFDPEVAAVFRTLNRTVHQTARKRLLATLCYALLDPARRELVYASAGHLFPYLIRRAGKVEALESVAYPLGVRDELEIRVRSARLGAGDTLFLFSDGIVEARRGASDQLFGFERLEESLRRAAGEGPERLRDLVLADVERFTGPGPRDDDQTILVLRLA